MFIQANIGRNVSTPAWQRAPKPGPKNPNPNHAIVEPMSDTAWANFQEDVRDAIIIAIYAPHPDLEGQGLRDQFQFHTGMGEWEGVAEESAHVSLYFDAKPGKINASAVHEHLSDRLADLAREYGQDAIAFVVTDSHLATR